LYLCIQDKKETRIWRLPFFT